VQMRFSSPNYWLRPRFRESRTLARSDAITLDWKCSAASNGARHFLKAFARVSHTEKGSPSVTNHFLRRIVVGIEHEPKETLGPLILLGIF